MLTSTEMKLLTLALDKAAYDGEAETACIMLIHKLRSRNAKADDLFKPMPPQQTDTDFYANFRKQYDNFNDIDNKELIPYGDNIMTFGKHKDLPLKEIPISYLKWVYDVCITIDKRLRYAVKLYLAEVGCSV